MANSLTVLPLTLVINKPEMYSWLASNGLKIPDKLAGTTSTNPSIKLLRDIVKELDWQCRPTQSNDTWLMNFDSRDGRWPPISELSLFEDSFAFRLGELFGPWEVCRRVAAACGPQIAIEASGCDFVLVTPDLSYKDFHLALSDCLPPEDGSDREWR